MATNGERYSAALLAESSEWTVAERAQIVRAGKLTDQIDTLNSLLGDNSLRAADRVQIAKTLGTFTNSLHKIEHELRQGQKQRAKLRGPGRPTVRNPDTPDEIADELTRKIALYEIEHAADYREAVAVFGAGRGIAGAVDLFAGTAPPAERVPAAPYGAPPGDEPPDAWEALSGAASGPDGAPPADVERLDGPRLRALPPLVEPSAPPRPEW